MGIGRWSLNYMLGSAYWGSVPLGRAIGHCAFDQGASQGLYQMFLLSLREGLPEYARPLAFLSSCMRVEHLLPVHRCCQEAEQWF
jgi:hypothetical protein